MLAQTNVDLRIKRLLEPSFLKKKVILKAS